MAKKVVIAALVVACSPHASTPHDDANEFALEPAPQAEVTASITSARAYVQRAGDAEGDRALAAVARRPPTNAVLSFAHCVVVTNGGEATGATPVNPDYPCDNPDIAVPADARLRCCRAPSPARVACGYCDDAAREDATLSELARHFERRCQRENHRREASFERESARAWIAWARERSPDRNTARSALGRARTAMDAATAADGVDDTSLRREIIEAERELLATAN
jgi:hypothetical protein